MKHLKTEEGGEMVEMEAILHELLDCASDLTPTELLKPEFDTVAEPVASVSQNNDDSIVPSDTCVQLNPPMAAPDESEQFLQLETINCQPGAFITSPVSKGRHRGACTC